MYVHMHRTVSYGCDCVISTYVTPTKLSGAVSYGHMHTLYLILYDYNVRDSYVGRFHMILRGLPHTSILVRTLLYIVRILEYVTPMVES